ncbi:MAG: hypothetical protein J0H42_20060, partial [Rhizobiales bacterium]|nr:hypothetical protein [Hyphomicrobiales bacterium]
NIRHSLRDGFTAYNVLSPENGSFASVAPWEVERLQVHGRQQRGVRTTRLHRTLRPRSSGDNLRVHRDPSLVVTMANAPLSGTGWREICGRFLLL